MTGPSRCAVILNPVKVSDGFRERFAAAAEAAGASVAAWLETTEADPGAGQAREALALGVDLVVAAGGDGTVRSVAGALANSGTPLGLIPAGTGNLLARNLALPLVEADALPVALRGADRAIDLVTLRADDGEPEYFAVMAGAGVDAMIMDETDPALKAKVGPAAYFVAAGRALGRLPMRVSVRIDQRRPRHRAAMLVLVANVGGLPGGINLVPSARPDDGLLDVFVASPRRLRDWLQVLLRILSRRGNAQALDIWRGRRVEVRIERADSYQLDGDTAGECRRLVAEVQPGALIVRVPRD